MMSEPFILSCESTVDVPYSRMKARDIPVLFYSYTIDGKEYEDDMGRDPEGLTKFYNRLASGELPSTSQINDYAYYDFLKELLKKGNVLHLAFGTGMTVSYQNAVTAAERLREEFPDRKLVVIDTLCSSSGYGLLVDYAADLRDNGKSMEETADWVTANCEQVHHQFYSTDMKFFRRSGRVSGTMAMVASILGICPIMHLNEEGRIVAYDKVRGKKNAVAYTVREMLRHARGGSSYNGRCYINHSNCIDDALVTKEEIEKAFSALKGKIEVFDIGNIVACHAGPGTVAVYFMGDERKIEKK